MDKLKTALVDSGDTIKVGCSRVKYVVSNWCFQPKEDLDRAMVQAPIRLFRLPSLILATRCSFLF